MPTYFGEHKYPGCEGKEFFTSDCDHGCGCWMGGSRSGGPDGVDPFGECPKNVMTAEKYVEYLKEQIRKKDERMTRMGEEIRELGHTIYAYKPDWIQKHLEVVRKELAAATKEFDRLIARTKKK